MLRCPVRDRYDVLHAQRCAKLFAGEIGFPRRACHELAIVATELSSNIVKYGNGGTLELTRIDDEQTGNGIHLAACDGGPPFRDLATALQDGCDDMGPIDPASVMSRSGTASGLGAVLRLTHSLHVEAAAGGKRVVAIRYLRRPLSRWPGPQGPG